jgi:DNA polymerase (family 10)
VGVKNQEIANIFYEIANYLEMERVVFKPYAYQKVAIVLENLEEDIADIYEKGGKEALEKIPGVGKNIADRIEEYLKTGKIKYYLQLKKKTPVNMEELIRVEGLGPKKVKVLYQKLRIRNLKDLEKKAKAHKIAPLFGFGEKTEKNILEAIKFLKRSKGRFLLGEIMPKVEEVYEKLKNLREVEEISTAGSVRRMKETIGDVDLLVISKNPQKVMDFFVSLPGIVKIWGKGSTKASLRLKEGFDMDIRVVPKKSYGSALQYFTGSKEHNIVLRKVAIDKGLKLNEYGLFRGSKMIAGKNEKEIYEALGFSLMPPEMRENQGEIEAALNKKLPKIIDYKDIKGDLHCHSSWDGGANSIEEIAKAAQGMGYEYVGIADHTKFLRIEHGLNEKQLELRNKEIEKLNKRFQASNSRFRILKGCEANILNDGSIDIKDEALAKLDFVIAGIHSSFKMEKSQMTERMTRAMRNPNVDIVSHPTGRIIKRRDEYQIDFDEILKVAKETGTILEINAYPERLDLNDQNIRRAKEAGVKMIINTDAHHIDQMRYMEFGIAQARRGWAEKEDIVNTHSVDKLLSFFN